jgi:hypothetical protein
MNNCYICWFFTHINEMHCSSNKTPVSRLVRQRCAEGFNPRVKRVNFLDNGLESRRGRGYSCLVLVVCRIGSIFYDLLIIRLESYHTGVRACVRVCVCVCDLETSNTKRPWPE